MQKRFNMRRSAIVPTEIMSPYWREPLDLVAADISPNGMYLISDLFPSVGEYVFCSFELSRSQPEFRLLSRVKRVNYHRRKTDWIRPGFGVEFLGVDEASLKVIATSLLGLPPPIPSKRRQVVLPKPSWDYSQKRAL